MTDRRSLVDEMQTIWSERASARASLSEIVNALFIVGVFVALKKYGKTNLSFQCAKP